MGNECKNKDLPPITESECPQDVGFNRYTIQVIPVSMAREIIREELEKYFQLNGANKDKLPIEELNISARLYNILKASKIDTVEQAKTIKHARFIRLRNAGPKTWNELEDAIKYHDTTIQLKRGQ